MLLLDEHNQIDVAINKNIVKKQNILSEIAEEDDVSTISESLKAHGSAKKTASLKGSFGLDGKQSI
jgi:hypothetical protein